LAAVTALPHECPVEKERKNINDDLLEQHAVGPMVHRDCLGDGSAVLCGLVRGLLDIAIV
jgi:hypothetical protein